jgi:hypothetical protein
MSGATSAFTSAGTTLAISAALPASVTPTAYAALSYTTIGEITDAGEIGRTYNEVTHSPIGTRGTVKLKGSYTDGTQTLQVAYAPGDAGQVLLETALDDDAFYSFKMTLQDGTVKYYQALVMSAPVNVGGVDSVTSSTISLSIKSGSIKTVLPA